MAIHDISDIDYKERAISCADSEEKFKPNLLQKLHSLNVPESMEGELCDVVFGKSEINGRSADESLMNHLVKLFLDFAENFDVVLLTLEGYEKLDTSSLSFVASIYSQAPNVIILGTSAGKIGSNSFKNMQEINVEGKRFSERMITDTLERSLIADMKGNPFLEASAGSLFVQFEITEESKTKKWKKGGDGGEQNVTSAKQSAALDAGDVTEFVLNRIDRLPTAVRKACFVGAILGSKFELLDIIIVFEHEKHVGESERMDHCRSVKENMNTAVAKGILDVMPDEDRKYHGSFMAKGHPFAEFNVKYRFAHNVWRTNILSSTLDSWKRDMHGLIAKAIEEAVEHGEGDHDLETLATWFSHLEASGEVSKAGEVALRIGSTMEEDCLTQEAKVIYREAMKAWKTLDNGDDSEAKVGGKNCSIEEKITPVHSSKLTHCRFEHELLGEIGLERFRSPHQAEHCRGTLLREYAGRSK